MAHIVSKKAYRPFLSTRIRVLGFSGLIGWMSTGLKIGVMKLEQVEELKKLIQFMTLVEKIFLVISIVSLTFFGIYTLILISRWIFTHKTKNPYLYLLFFQLDTWLQDVGLYLAHGEGFVIIPRVRKYRKNHEIGIEIQILGDLRKKMLEVNSSLTSYLSSKGSDWYVSESYECRGGYIRYIFCNGINSERLDGDDLEL